jgi:hypothetical protein
MIPRAQARQAVMKNGHPNKDEISYQVILALTNTIQRL